MSTSNRIQSSDAAGHLALERWRDMALHGCLRCLKYIVFTLNFVVWVAGMLLLGLAVYMRIDPQTNHYVKAGYATEVNTFHIICYILMASGGVMTFVGFLGCCGAFQESRCMLGTFFVMLFLVLATDISGCVWAYMQRDQAKKSVTQTFRNFVVTEYGKDSLTDETVDFVQSSLHCCGAEGPEDWRLSSWTQSDLTHVGDVPSSCCINNSKVSRFMGSGGLCGIAGSVLPGQTHPGVWHKGCGPMLIAKFQENMLILISSQFGLAIIQLLGLCFSFSLCCGMRRQSYGGYKS